MVTTFNTQPLQGKSSNGMMWALAIAAIAAGFYFMVIETKNKKEKENE
jgi:preprotein translocase subunit YajC